MIEDKIIKIGAALLTLILVGSVLIVPISAQTTTSSGNTFETNVLDFVEQLRARPLRHRPFFRWILKSDGSRKKVPARNPHRVQHRNDSKPDILKVRQHTIPQKSSVSERPANQPQEQEQKKSAKAPSSSGT